MLFTDGPACTIEDLRNQDSAVLDTASGNHIDLNAKIELAGNEIRAALHVWLDRPVTMTDYVWRPATHINQVVITLEMQEWQTALTLEKTYADAYFNQLVDRYQHKWNEYKRLSGNAYQAFLGRGLALVGTPIPRAGQPTLGTIEAESAAGTFYTSASWTSAIATTGNQEGAPSEPAATAVPEGHALTITPTAAPATAEGGNAQHATGWNLYAGPGLTDMTLQNTLPMQPGTTATYIPGASTTGPAPGKGQKPDYRRQTARTMLRG